MRYKLFGHSGLRVSELCLGAMTFGSAWGWGSDIEESRAVFDCFAQAGGTFVDTAYIYTEGESERFLGEFVKADRHHFVLSTKYGTMSKADVTVTGGSRKAMRHAVEESLRRLGTDYIDIYWLHAWDNRTPVEEIMRGLDDLVRAGKVLYLGVSNAAAWRISRANAMADLRGWSAFAGIQTEYSLLERTAERELLPMARDLDLAVTAWSPLANGTLSGKYVGNGAKAGRRGDRALTDREAEVATLVADLAAEIGEPPSAIAVAALGALSPNNQIIPLIGARTPDQLRQNMRCVDVTFSAEQLARIQQSTAISIGSPHEMLNGDYVRNAITGGADQVLQARGF